MLLDELRFSPYLGTFGARVYDPYYQIPNAVLGSHGETMRYVRNDFQEVIATVGPDENVAGINGRYYSRTGNSDTFLPAAPNSSLSIQAADGGVYQRFVEQSTQWQDFWQATEPNPTSNWQVLNGALCHTVSQSDVLTLIGSEEYTNFGIQLNISPQELITQVLGIRIGNQISVRWTPPSQSTSGSWELYDELNQQPILPPVVPPYCFSISQDYKNDLDSGDVNTVSQALASQGILLSADVTITTIKPGNQWQIDDSEQFQTYNVTLDNEVLQVSQLTLDSKYWLLAVINNAILFYADGQQIFSYQSTESIAGPVALFTGNQVSYQDIVTFQGPQVRILYRDGSGQQSQSQSLEDSPGEDGTIASNNCIVTGSIYDELGRAAVKTKPMRYGNTLLTFQNNLVVVVPFDWNQGVLKGDVATYYSASGSGFSNDQGYPYLRTLFEDSPQGRIIAKGNP
ncbi:MAG: DUF6443 domain-containing protein, partial [Microcystaceae cyanobacterium]